MKRTQKDTRMGKPVRVLFFTLLAKHSKVNGKKNDLLLLDFRVINGTTKKEKEAKKPCRLRLSKADTGDRES